MARALPPPTPTPPAPTPEGALIRRVRESLRPRLSIPAAAKLAEVSEATWGNIERGYRTTKGGQDPTPVVGTSATVAHMAYAVGITPADLERVGRADAAAVLTEMQGPTPEVESLELDRGRVWFTVPPGLSDEDREAIRRWAEEMAERIHRGQPGDSR